MNFASKYVYEYNYSDEECVSDDEFEGGMTLSDSEEEADLSTVHEDGEEVAKINRMNVLKSATAPVPAVPPVLSAPPALPAPRLPTASSSGAVPRTGVEHTSAKGRGRLSKLLPAKMLAYLGGSTEESDRAVPVRKDKGPPAIKKKTSHWRSRKATDSTDTDRAEPVRGRNWRRADTNVVVVKFDQLAMPSGTHAGDPVACTECQGLMSHLSKPQPRGDQQMWTCEFCGVENTVDVEPEELPKSDDVTFMLQPAPATTMGDTSGKDQSLLIFCVDVSGSMCVTTEVPGKVNLRGSRLASLQDLNTERENQWMPGQRRDVTFVSRLQAVQAAVHHQIGDLAKEHPDRRVGLISFNNEVTVVGDGSEAAMVVAGDKLGDHETLLRVAQEVPTPKAVKDTSQVLGDKIFDLEERGATALGPALLLSVAMAAEVPGSKVLLCTDGIANVGLGSLEEKKNDGGETLKKASEFYSEVSRLAQDKGVCVSVISIKGTDCQMLELGKVADETGGQVNIVDPMKLTQEFGSILADPIIATNVSATFHVHSRLYIRDEDAKQNVLERYVGNVTKETEVSFEYGIRHNEKKRKKATPSEDHAEKSSSEKGATAGPSTSEGATAGPSASEGATAGPSASEGATAAPPVKSLNEVPFQLLIKYTDLEGAQSLRVITRTMPITRDRHVAEEEIDVAVLGVHTAQQSAQLALKGKYTNARLNSMMNQRLVSRHSKAKPSSSSRADYASFYNNIAPLEMQLNSVQQQLPVRVRDEVEMRAETCSDLTAKNIYQTKSVSSKAFKKK